jgi:FemAB-related protein (PEP-CTERM system-associated)
MPADLLRAPAVVASRHEPSEVAVATEGDASVWDAFVATQSQAGYHRWAWRRVFSQALGHECMYLIAREGETISGVLPLVAIDSRLFGRTLTSLPFVNYGGVRATTTAAAQALLDRARTLARDGGYAHVELRHHERQFPDLPVKQHKVTMLLALGTAMWERIDRKVRNQIRKAEKSGLTVTKGGAELLHEFYEVFSRNMRDLGTPVYSPRLFAEVLDAFPTTARLHVVRLAGRPVAAGLAYRHDSTTEVPWASSIRDYNSLCPNHLLYWHVIETAVADGCETLDFGRSTPHEGTYKFKEQWGAVPHPLHWEYPHLRDNRIPDANPANPKFHAAVAAWKRMPLWLANRVGPHIVRMIP